MSEVLKTGILRDKNGVGVEFTPAAHADQHGWSDTLTWDGDETGRTVVVMSDKNGRSAKYIHMSDKVLSGNDFANGAYITTYVQDGDNIRNFGGYIPYGSISVESDGFIELYNLSVMCIPTDGYTYGPGTFPQKGVYFYVENDNNEYIDRTTRLTVPGFDFESGSDPITPEMIEAAPKHHASDTGMYGVSSAENYGHLRLAELNGVYNGEYGLFNFGEGGNLLDKDGNVIEDPVEYLKNCATGAMYSFACNQVYSAEFEDIEAQLSALGETCTQLRKDVNTLMGK